MTMHLGEIGKFGLVLALAAAPVAALATTDDQPAAPAEMQKLLQDCDAHKFETTVHVTGDDGKPHDSDVKVCGKPGQSDADWVRTLKDIVDKTAANQEMPEAVKGQVITALNAEILRLAAAVLPKEQAPVAGLQPRSTPKDDLNSDYSSLPPLPPPVTEATTVVAAPAPAAASPVAGAAVSPLRIVPPPIPVAPAPRLTVRCMAGRDVSRAEPCEPMERGNLLVVQAQESMASGVLLKFFRRGEPRGDVRLPPMRAGQPITVALPAGICSGIAHTRIEIRASGAPGSAEAVLGPYDLRC